MFRSLFAFVLFSSLFSQNEQSISNVSVGQLTDGSGLIEVKYDLIDESETFASFNVEVQISIDESPFESISLTSLSGDVGENVIPGLDKLIYIQAPGETYSTNVVVKIIATGYVVTSNLPFTMISISSSEGVSNYQNESINYSFEIMQNELTNAELVTFLETYDFNLTDGEPIYDCSNYVDYFYTNLGQEESQVECYDSSALNYGHDAPCVYSSQVGCTDPYAYNFNLEATYYDCSCYYTSSSYTIIEENSQNCFWSNLSSSEIMPGGQFLYLDINDDDQYDLMVEDGGKLILSGCDNPNSPNFPIDIVEFLQSNNINENCFEIQNDGSCTNNDCNNDFLGNNILNPDNSIYGSVNINEFSSQEISFEGSSFIIQSGAGTKPAIFNYDNCVDGVIVALLTDYYGLRIPTGGEWVKAARGDDSRCWPWVESDCETEAISYCESIFECMTNEEFDSCQESAEDLFLQCQINCNNSNNNSSNCEIYNNINSCNEIDGCSWIDLGYCADTCTECMNSNQDICFGNPCSQECPCCDACDQSTDMTGMMECVNECSSTYGNTYEYCNGDTVNECNHCKENYQDCESVHYGQFIEFLDTNSYDDDDGDGLYTSDNDQFGFYSYLFYNRFNFLVQEENISGVKEVGQYPNGISIYGLYDVIGNAPEIVKYDNQLWLVGFNPNDEHVASFCENNNSIFDDNTNESHGSLLSPLNGFYFKYYGLRLSRTTQE